MSKGDGKGGVQRDRFGTPHPGGYSGYQGAGTGSPARSSRGPQKPVGEDYIARYNGWPTDRLMQVGSILGGFPTGPVGAIVGGIYDDITNGPAMTQPDGFSKFGKSMDTGGGVGAMEKARRRRYAGIVGNSLGIADTSLGA